MTEFARGHGPRPALSEQDRDPELQYVVGAVILDGAGRAYVQQRSWQVRHFPGCWDIVGGHVDPGESLYGALTREIREETGWELTRVHRVASVFDWCGNDGIARREIDTVAEVSGDLGRPALERDKFIHWTWADANALQKLIESSTFEESTMLRLCLDIVGPPQKMRHKVR
ncbi:hypothetical protein GCM10009854_48210 [Saccharopolyspora halophila]|uniref:Nudix hydrolase domain-containing protein n=1 Tax=Saccharopolyspora halophila TaxID=405551 RepID=A0ABN3GWA9_9PSEU